MAGKALFCIGGSSGLGWQDFLEICQACDEMGYHGFYPSDHLLQIRQGRGPSPQRLEGPTVMAAMSGHTKSLQLGMLVINNNLRHPVITAKMINTIDHASGGRAELGIGAGNLEVDPTVARDADARQHTPGQRRGGEGAGGPLDGCRHQPLHPDDASAVRPGHDGAHRRRGGAGVRVRGSNLLILIFLK